MFTLGGARDAVCPEKLRQRRRWPVVCPAALQDLTYRRVRRSGADSSRKGNPGSPRNNASQSVTQEMAFRVLRLKGHVGTQLADRGFAAELGLDWKTWVSLSRTRCRNGPNHGAASKHKRKKEARHKSRKHTSEEAIPFLCRVLKARKVVLVGGQT